MSEYESGNKFQSGDTVSFVNPGGAASLQHLPKGSLFTVLGSEYPLVTVKSNVDGSVGSVYESRFQKAVPNDTTGAAAGDPVNDYLRARAEELAGAIEAGTMVGRYSALGFLHEFLRNFPVE